MNDDIEHKKDFVLNLYPGPSWKNRVRNQMSDAQIIAIYLREINNPKRGQKPKEDEESGDDGIPF